MKIAFAGTPDFAAVALQRLHDAGFEIAVALTQPDRPAGRGMKLVDAPVKALALARGIPVEQPRSLRLDGRYPDEAARARDVLAAAAPRALVVAAYGLLLPRWTLSLPALGCLNIHASLLPRWRGAAPVQRAIEAGDARTGVTIMQMDEGLDTGPMLLAQDAAIEPDDTAATLTARLASLGARLVVDALRKAERGELQPVAQPEDGATYAPKVGKGEAPIDWSVPAVAIERRVRAFDPFPGATFQLGAETVKLWRASVVDAAAAPGSVLSAGAEGIVVACGEGALRLQIVQRAGGRRITARELMQKTPVAAGMKLAG